MTGFPDMSPLFIQGSLDSVEEVSDEIEKFVAVGGIDNVDLFGRLYL
jgi:hypothetical protein